MDDPRCVMISFHHLNNKLWLFQAIDRKLTMRPNDPTDKTQSTLIVRLGSLHLHFCQIERMAVDRKPKLAYSSNNVWEDKGRGRQIRLS